MKVCPKCRSVYVSEKAHCGVDGARLVVQDDDPLVGHKLDRYHFVERLGAGGMGIVYRARHTTLDRDVAVKVLFGDIVSEAGVLMRFQREAWAMGKVDHPNVVSVYDFVTLETGLSFLVMELVQGITLLDAIQQSGASRENKLAPVEPSTEPVGRFPPERVARIARQVADGLADAHRLGFVHRDLKPANIMLTGPKGKELAKILDFGIVHTEDENKLTRLTTVGAIVGTPAYMAPEQINAQVGQSADLYSLGVILYEMIAGKLPFSARSAAHMLAMHAAKQPPPLPECGGLEAIAMRLLEKRPQDRPGSAEEIVHLIDACHQKEPPERALPAQRTLQLAANRLRSLGAEVSITENELQGLLRIDSTSFRSFEDIQLGSELYFVVRGRNVLEFVAPPPARHLPPIPFFEMSGREQLLRALQDSWSVLIEETNRVLERARRFVRSAQLIPEAWAIETKVAERVGELTLRFDWGLQHLELIAIDGAYLPEGEQRPRFPLPSAPDDFDYVSASQPVIRAAEIERSREEPEVIELTARKVSSPTSGLVELTSEVRRPSSGGLVILADDEGVSTQDLMPEEAEHPIQLRAVRVPVTVPARLIGPRTLSVTIKNVNARGVFVSIKTGFAPPIDTIVRLSGFGPQEVSARVVYHRTADEAAVLRTTEGAGLAFVPSESDKREYTRGPFCVMVGTRDFAMRDRIVQALQSAQCEGLLVDNLVALAVGLFHETARLVLIDPSLHADAWSSLGMAMRFDEGHVPVLIADSPPAEPPNWATFVLPHTLSASVIRAALERRF